MTTNSFWRDVRDISWFILLWPYHAARAFKALGAKIVEGDDLDKSGLFEQTTESTTMTGWGSGATGYYYGGSTGCWPPTTAMPMVTTPPPPDIQNKPKPLEIPDLDAPRVINLD